MREDFDIAVIGAGVGGLAAAALLAARGRRVVVLEQELSPPEPAGALFALDPALVSGLKLARRGLRVTHRDLSRTGWDEDGAALTLTRDPRQAARAIAAFNPPDAQAWPGFAARLQDNARALRRWWWHAHRTGRPQDVLGARARAGFEHLCLSGADAFVGRVFQSPRLIGLLLADAALGGLALSEPGSALALVWRAAQEMDGQAGARALVQPGALIAALRMAARDAGAQLRLGVRVMGVESEGGMVRGVALADGQAIAAPLVLSSLSRLATETLAGLTGADMPSAVGEAAILLALDEHVVLPPDLRGGEVVLAPSLAAYADAHEAARAGRLAAEPPLRLVSDAPGRLTVSLPLAPLTPEGGWRAFQAPLAAQTVKTLNRHIPGLARGLIGAQVLTPRLRRRSALADLLAPPGARVATRLQGLYLCGDDAEPLPCVSGRAGRFAAQMILKHR